MLSYNQTDWNHDGVVNADDLGDYITDYNAGMTFACFHTPRGYPCKSDLDYYKSNYFYWVAAGPSGAGPSGPSGPAPCPTGGSGPTG